mmetsp:Transcript_30249/g.64099  ORF Transcript_30249/g.64099 Transcript_30249/m.64099 type:complete len:101 (-) Transcript_30249:877-1179(-)
MYFTFRAPEDWKGEFITFSEIVSALQLKKSQRQRVENAIATTRHAHLTGEEYNSMRAFRACTCAIVDVSIKQQMIVDLRERVSVTPRPQFLQSRLHKTQS